MPFPAASVAVPTLQPGQMNFGGLTFAGVVAGTPYQLVSAQGLDMPAIRSGDVDVPRDQGQLPGLDVYGGRSIPVDIVVISDRISLQHAKQAFVAALNATGATEYPLFLQLPGMSTVAVMARARKWTWNLDVSTIAPSNNPLGVPWVTGSVMFQCTDPRVYGVPTWDVVTTLTALDNSVFVTNGGNMEMRPIVTFNGPLNVPFASNTTVSGAPLLILDSGSLPTILSGDKVIVDMGRHSVVYQPASSAPFTVRNWVAGGADFWNLPPGENGLIVGATSVSGSIGVEWAWAWQL